MGEKLKVGLIGDQLPEYRRAQHAYTEGVVELKGAHPLVKALLRAGIAFREEKAAAAGAPLAAR